MKISVAQIMQLKEDVELLTKEVDRQVKASAINTPERERLGGLVAAINRMTSFVNLLCKSEVTIKG